MTIVSISAINNNIGFIQLKFFGFENEEMDFEEKKLKKMFFFYEERP
jgi:hypothetical protein